MLQVKELSEIIKNGGATLSTSGQAVSFNYGYQVSLKDCYIINIKHVNKILKAVNGLLSEVKSGQFLGLWVDGQKIYIDISEKIDDVTKAVKIGKARKQISIYNWATGDCIYC